MAKKITKEHITKECQRILRSTPLNGCVENQSDFEFLLSLFQCHSEWDIKQGGQKIKRIEVRRTDWNNKCFWLVREDGTGTDISFKACLKSITKEENVKRACRTAEDPRILEYKRSLTFPRICTISHEVLNSLKDTHIDHYDPDFDVIVNEWAELHGGYYELSKHVNMVEDDSIRTEFVDPKLSESFAEYSKNRGKIRAISKRANLSMRRKKAKGNSYQ